MSEPEDPETVDLAPEPDFAIGALHIRPSSRSIAPEGGEEQTIEPRVMRVLVALWRGAGQVISRDRLIAACWDGRIVGDDAINSCIAKVRRIGETHEAFTIETVPRVGYRLRPRTMAADVPASPHPALASARPAWIAWAALASLALVLTAGAWTLFALPRSPAAPALKVAVLPLETASSDSVAQAFSVGLAAEVGGVLSENQLQSVSPMQLAGKTEAERSALLRRLGAGFAVSGTISDDQNGLRARMRLDDLAEGVMLWSADFGPRASARDLQGEVASRLADVVGSAVAARRSAGGHLNAATLALYLRARDRFDPIDQRGIDSNLGLCEQVVKNAPAFAQGRVLLAMTLLIASATRSDADLPALLERVRAEANEAMRLDPADSSPYVPLAAALPARAWRERGALLEKGATHEASWVDSALLYGRFLTTAGYVRAGVGYERRAVGAPHPGAAPVWWYGQALYLQGDTTEGLRVIGDMLARQPSHVNARRVRFLITALARPAAEASAILDDPARRPLDLDPSAIDAYRLFLKARSSGREIDRRRASEALKTTDPQSISRSAIIPMLSVLGDLDAAFDVATLYAAEPRFTLSAQNFVPNFLFGPDTAPMRADPRFVGLAEKLGLTGYWRTAGRWPDFCEAEARTCAAMGKS